MKTIIYVKIFIICITLFQFGCFHGYFDRGYNYEINIKCIDENREPLKDVDILFGSMRKGERHNRSLSNLRNLGKSDDNGIFEKKFGIFYGFSDPDRKGKYQHIKFKFSKPGYHPTEIEYYIPEIMSKYYINLGEVSLYSVNAKDILPVKEELPYMKDE